jgi:hypothetical protein
MSGDDDAAGHDAVGWQAIDAALERLYGDQEPLHLGTITRWASGGPDPLDGMSAYLHPDGHWHYVGLGLTELYDKVSDQPDISGWGFELTLRLAHAGAAPPQRFRFAAPPPPEAQPPRWPFLFLQHLARHVFEQSAIVEVEDCLPGAPRDATGLAGFLAVLDPELGRIETPHGTVRFLQLVGVDAAQLARARGSAAATREVLAELRAASPLLVTHLRPA